MASRCELTELYEDQCAHCRKIEPDPVRTYYPYDSVDRVKIGVVITAQYPGACGLCGEHYEAGSKIGHAGEHGWVLVECCGEPSG
jgi:hypothetical protein